MEIFIKAIVLITLFRASYIDIKEQQVNRSTYIAIGVVSILVSAVTLIQGNYFEILASIMLSLVLGLVYLVFRNSFGIGDFKVLALLCFAIGYKACIATIFFASFAGLFYGLYCLLIKRNDRKAEIPFVPFICFGYVLTLVI